MCRWMIHAWWILLHCLIRTSIWHCLSSHYHRHKICIKITYFCLGHFLWLPKYYSIQSWRNVLSWFTTSTPGMVQNKMPKTSIRLKKLKWTLHSSNQINPRNKTCWKILLWLTKNNLHHSENYYKFFWPIFIITDLS